MGPATLHFANPDWLWGLLALPPALAAAFWHSRAKHSTLLVGNPRLVEMSSGLWSAQWIPWFFRFLVLALCLFAAARPQAGQKKTEEKKPVTDLLITQDVSYSMLSTDFEPSRIVAAKKILAQFLDEIQNVRVGLTVFAGSSFTQCPLTTDVDIVKRLLANVDVYSVHVNGTAIGDALVFSLGRLQAGAGKTGDGEPAKGASSLLTRILKTSDVSDPDENKPNSQAILLLTDGANNTGAVDPLTAARIAASRGVKIYAIGIGTVNRRIPAVFIRPDGKQTYGLDQNGNLIYEDPMDMGVLNEIARITGGRAYNASNNSTLKSVLDDIARLEKRDVSVTTHWEYNELASYFLLAAFLLLVLDIGLETTVLRTLP